MEALMNGGGAPAGDMPVAKAPKPQGPVPSDVVDRSEVMGKPPTAMNAEARAAFLQLLMKERNPSDQKLKELMKKAILMTQEPEVVPMAPEPDHTMKAPPIPPGPVNPADPAMGNPGVPPMGNPGGHTIILKRKGM